MKVCITFDLNEKDRRAVAAFNNEDGLANYRMVRDWINSTIMLALNDLHDGMEEEE